MTDQTESSLPEFYDLILKTRAKVSKLNTGHIPAKDLLTHYILPLFATLHDELDETLNDLSDEISEGGGDGVDFEAAQQASEAIVALAAFVEKSLIAAGVIAREDTPQGPAVKATDKTPPGLLEEFSALQVQVVGALNALAEEGSDEDEDEDEGEEDEEGEDEGSEDDASEATVEPDTTEASAA